MASVVDLCNRAITKVGGDRITALDDKKSKQAKACNSAYETVRDAMLRVHPWNFTMARALLANLSTDPAFGYDYQYQLPSDCLKIVEVDTTYDWIVEGRKVLTDEGPALKIRYQMKVTDPNEFDSLFFEVLAARLAYEICEELTQSNTKKAEIKKDFQELLTKAKMNDAQEGSPSRFKEDDWVNVRY